MCSPLFDGVSPMLESMIAFSMGRIIFLSQGWISTVLASGTVTLADVSHGSATLSSAVAYRGNTVIVTCTPASGYKVASVVAGADTALDKIDDTHYAYKTSDADVTITVTMESV